MRDLLVSAVILGSLPFILRRPWIGILVWCWLSYMNPHRLAYGFAYTAPFALIVALTTLVGLLFSNEEKKIPWTRETKVLAVLIFWMLVTTSFALVPTEAWPQFEKVIKIQLMTFVTLILINNRQRLDAMIWMIALSIGFYGIKGGLFTIAKGGVYHVQGPEGTFIGGNNELGLAMIMTIPLMRYLQLVSKRIWVRNGLSAAMFLTAIAAIGTQSRGALLAASAMGLMLWWKSRNKFFTGLLVIAAVVTIAMFMPEAWYERMSTIKTYDQDESALGRINAWRFAWNLAMDRPLVGGGFETFQPWLFGIYAPEPDRVHDVHSIYFEMLGEQGFVGLFLFVLLGVLTWRTATRIRKVVALSTDIKSLSDLAAMLQVSLIGYAVGGAFLGLAYFDFPYHIMASVVILSKLVDGKDLRVNFLPRERNALIDVGVVNNR